VQLRDADEQKHEGKKRFVRPITLKTISILLELKAVCLELLQRRHKLPALLNLYAFIDICASLASEKKGSTNAEVFQSFLERYSTFRWDKYGPSDLWAARSSLLHSYSPIGRLTAKGAKPLFYYAWPETPEEVTALLESRGYRDYVLVDIGEIKWLAIDAFNSLHRRIEEDARFESSFLANAEHLLSSSFYVRLGHELDAIEQTLEKSEATQ
jgi:hypothetical protein